jgi:hypothetical protein
MFLFSCILVYADENTEFLPESFFFDGIDDLIVVPNSDTLNPPSMTVSFEFMLKSGASLKSGNNKTRQFILFKKNPMQHFNEGIAIYYNEEGANILATVSDLNRKQVYAYTPKGSIEPDIWYNITVSADSIDIRVYLDSLLQRKNITGFPLIFDKEPLLIGGRNNVIIEYEKYGGMFSGEIRNLKIYHKSITEIGEEYFFSKDSSLDTLLILDYNQYVSNGIVPDNTGMNNGVYVKGRPSKSELREPDFVRIHPNPVKGKTEVIFKIPSIQDVKVSIKDLSGVEVKVIHTGSLKKGEHRLVFYPEGLASGYYICVIEAEGKIRMSSFLITE